MRILFIIVCIRGYLDIVNEFVKVGVDVIEDDIYKNLYIEIDEYLLNCCNVVE